MDGVDGIGDLLSGLAEGFGALIELAVQLVFYTVELVVWLFSKLTASRMRERRLVRSEKSKLKLSHARDRLARFRRARAKRVATWIKLGLLGVGVLVLLWFVYFPDRGTDNSDASPQDSKKSRWHFKFSFRKSDEKKPVEAEPPATQNPEPKEAPKSRWKLPFTKREKNEEPAKE